MQVNKPSTVSFIETLVAEVASALRDSQTDAKFLEMAQSREFTFHQFEDPCVGWASLISSNGHGSRLSGGNPSFPIPI